MIVSFETYEHIKEEEKLLHNYYQLLNPGGKLIISTPLAKAAGKNAVPLFMSIRLLLRNSEIYLPIMLSRSFSIRMVC